MKKRVVISIALLFACVTFLLAHHGKFEGKAVLTIQFCTLFLAGALT